MWRRPVSGGSTGPVVVLVGLAAAGKTSAGARLARVLEVPFRDTDDDIVRLAGKSPAEIVLGDGFGRFRELDERAVLEALAEHDGVLALGAGSVLSERVRAELMAHTVAHLTVELTTAAARITTDPTRAVRSLDPAERLGKADSIRTPLYRAVASFTVRTDYRTPEEVAAAILGGLASGASR